MNKITLIEDVNALIAMSENLEYNSPGEIIKDSVINIVAASLPSSFVEIVKAINSFSKLTETASSNFRDQLSEIQKKKFDIVINRATETFNKLIGTEEQTLLHPESNDYIMNTFEFSLHILQNAMNEFQMKKLVVLGDFWGKVIADGNIDWDNLHTEGNIFNSLTYRQLILLKLLDDGFPEEQNELYINNPSICVELNQLLQLGFWQMSGVYFGTNNSGPIQISELKKTDFCSNFVERLMLNNLEIVDVEKVKNSLFIEESDEILHKMTEEDISWGKL